MKITDTHAHYDDRQFDIDRDSLLASMLYESVKYIVSVGSDVSTSRFNIGLAEKYPRVFAAVGIHPENADTATNDDLVRIEELAKHEKAVAIGEIGLDYHYDGYDREGQISLLIAQLELAKKLSLPVIIHSRDATADILEILRKHRPEKTVMHCFSGSVETAAQLIEMGCYISFTGLLTFKNAKKAAAAAEYIPIERIMLETDCPYMAPTPHRGERCDSSLLRFTAERLAEIKNMSPEETAEICNKNAESFFGLYGE